MIKTAWGWHVIRAVARRDFTGYFRNPTGYLFITLLILLGAVTAFWQERFFLNNLATLDTLNALFPYLLLFFVPAVTMHAWASEKTHGTEELLLTLPARDVEIVAGKYLACLGVYAVSLAFSVSHVIVLGWLGRPDVGLMMATYLGYGLLGAALIGMGMVGSLLTANATVGFLLGTLLCGALVFVDQAGAVLPDAAAGWLIQASPVSWFQELARGIISPAPFVGTLGWVGVSWYVMLALLRRRFTTPATRAAVAGHGWTRGVAWAMCVFSVTVVAGRTGGRWDWTQERLHSLSPQTEDILRTLDPSKPVYVQAFVSAEVPQELVPIRSALVGLLNAYEARSRGAMVLRIHETEKFSDAAREAQDQYGIRPQTLVSTRGGRTGSDDVYVGAVFTCGSEEVVIPFFHKGMSVEYELTRALRVAARSTRLRLGVLTTDAKLFGGMDFQAMSSQRKWSVLEELGQQYDVIQISPDAEIAKDVDVLMVAMPSSLTQLQMGYLTAAIRRGTPTLMFDDPLPLTDMGLSPGEPKGGQRGMFGGGAPPQSKGNVEVFYRQWGIVWPWKDVAWDVYNPHPQLAHLAPEVVFVGAQSGADHPFHPSDSVSAGLQEVVALFPGHLRSSEASRFEVTPLLRTTKQSGTLSIDQVVQRGFFGLVGLNAQRPHVTDRQSRVLAVRIKERPVEEVKQVEKADKVKSGNKGGSLVTRQKASPPIHLVVVADLDMISEEFFEIRKQGIENLTFDNIAFVANAVDVLAGDEAFVGLRKRRKQHRTLEAVEAEARTHQERSLKETQLAEEKAKQRLQEAQASLGKKVGELKARRDLDEQTKAIMVGSLEEVENRRLAVTKGAIEDEKKSALERSRTDMERNIRRIQRRIKWLAVLLPPIPTFLLGAWVFWRQRRRERELIPVDRWADGGFPPPAGRRPRSSAEGTDGGTRA